VETLFNLKLFEKKLVMKLIKIYLLYNKNYSKLNLLKQFQNLNYRMIKDSKKLNLGI